MKYVLVVLMLTGCDSFKNDCLSCKEVCHDWHAAVSKNYMNDRFNQCYANYLGDDYRNRCDERLAEQYEAQFADIRKNCNMYVDHF